jgi:hypothetical protein
VGEVKGERGGERARRGVCEVKGERDGERESQRERPGQSGQRGSGVGRRWIRQRESLVFNERGFGSCGWCGLGGVYRCSPQDLRGVRKFTPARRSGGAQCLAPRSPSLTFAPRLREFSDPSQILRRIADGAPNGGLTF